MRYVRKAKPRFQVGDRVVDFRGNRAMVVEVIKSSDWKYKSHRVQVTWDNIERDDQTAYYEEVFEPCP